MHRVTLKTVFSLSLLVSPFVSGQQEPPAHVPAESFYVPEGFEVSVWASSPMLYNPTNMDVDYKGRIWVAEGRNYRMFKNQSTFAGDPKGDRIMVLTDSNQDGTADESHVFVQDPDLIAPLGVAVIDNKVVVSQPPTLLVYTDVNRDAVFDPAIDKKEVLLKGFGGQDHDHSLHAVTTGPSGQWYFNTGNAGTHIVEGSDGWTLRVGSVYNGGAPSVTDEGPNQGGQPGLKSDDGHVYVGSVALRMNPDGTGLRPIGHNMRNSYEETVTSFGDVFQNDNDDPPACRTTWLMEYGNLGFASNDGTRKWQTDRRPGQTAPIAEWRQEDPGSIPAGDVYGNGSPTGICYYENGALGQQYEGLLLSCEAARNVVFGYLPVPDGAGFKLERFDFFRSKREGEFDEKGGEKAAQANNFRPSDVCVGPDGSIYVADWFDPGVGGHSMRDKSLSGAIYRITPKGSNPTTPTIDLETAEGQLAALKSSANNVRNAGFTRLQAKGAESYAAVEALLSDSSPYMQARAVWLLAQLGDQGVQRVEQLLSETDSDQLRITAFRALRLIDHDVLKHAQDLADDPSVAVRREVALSLRNHTWEQAGEILTTLAKQYEGKDRWYLEALGTGATGKEVQLYTACMKAGKGSDFLNWSPAFAKIAWRLHPNSSVNAFRARAMSADLPLASRKEALTALGLITTKPSALAMVEVAESGPEDTKKLAQWWLYSAGQHIWKDYVAEMKGLNKKASSVKAERDYLVPTDTPPITELNVPDALALQGDAEKGSQTIARCYMCHQVGGNGIDFGPPLDEWGQGRSREEIATAIIDPNAGVAHGFEATEVVTNDGHTLQGLMLFGGRTSILKVMGGSEVTYNNTQTKSIKTTDKSLMLSAGQLGLQHQDVADIVEFLKVGKGKSKETSAVAPTPVAPQATPAPKTVTNDKPKAAAKKPNKSSLPDHVAALNNTNCPPIKWGAKSDKKRILFLAGSTTHRHGYHEYKAGCMLLANALNESGLAVEAKVHWFNWPEDESCFDDVDTCIIYADGGGAYTAENYAFLDQKYQDGMGLMFMHFGVHPEKPIAEKYYKPWIGGFYDDEFSVNPSWIAEMVPKQGHPISNGLSGTVKAFDEFYYNLNFDQDCDDCYPLATATPTTDNMIRYGSSKFWNKQAADQLGTEQSLLWCRDPENAPRGAGFVGGHYHRNWAIDDYRMLILNTITWVSRLEVPESGVPSQPITKVMLNHNLNRPEWPEAVELPSAEDLGQAPGKPPELGPDGRVAPKKPKKK